jgi:hypothetical protein
MNFVASEEGKAVFADHGFAAYPGSGAKISVRSKKR